MSDIVDGLQSEKVTGIPARARARPRTYPYAAEDSEWIQKALVRLQSYKGMGYGQDYAFERNGQHFYVTFNAIKKTLKDLRYFLRQPQRYYAGVLKRMGGFRTETENGWQWRFPVNKAIYFKKSSDYRRELSNRQKLMAVLNYLRRGDGLWTADGSLIVGGSELRQVARKIYGSALIPGPMFSYTTLKRFGAEIAEDIWSLHVNQ